MATTRQSKMDQELANAAHPLATASSGPPSPATSCNASSSTSPLDNRPTVFVVDDDPHFCKLVALMLRSTSLAVECFVEPNKFLLACQPDWPGCMLLDLSMPEMSGTELRRRLVLKGCRQPFVIVSGWPDVTMAVRATQLGAVDYLMKPVDREQLADAVSRALYLDQIQRRKQAKTTAVQSRLESLTPREHQVLDLVVEGLLSKEIAKRLDISIKTVEVHRSNIMRKMQANSLAQLVASVARHSQLDTNEEIVRAVQPPR